MTPPYSEEFYEMIVADKSVDSQYDFSINFFKKMIQQMAYYTNLMLYKIRYQIPKPI